MNNIQNPMRKSGEKWPASARSDFQEAAMFYNAEKRLPAALHEIAIGVLGLRNRVFHQHKRLRYRINLKTRFLSIGVEKPGFSSA